MRVSKAAKKRTFSAAAGAASVALALGFAAPAAASVEPASFADCPANRICVFAATNGGTVPGWRHFPATPPGSCTDAPIPTLAGVRGALSVYNRTGKVQKVYTAFGCGGDSRTVNVGSAIPNLGVTYWSIGG